MEFAIHFTPEGGQVMGDCGKCPLDMLRQGKESGSQLQEPQASKLRNKCWNESGLSCITGAPSFPSLVGVWYFFTPDMEKAASRDMLSVDNFLVKPDLRLKPLSV